MIIKEFFLTCKSTTATACCATAPATSKTSCPYRHGTFARLSTKRSIHQCSAPGAEVRFALRHPAAASTWNHPNKLI
jgi:hypothetical protein